MKVFIKILLSLTLSSSLFSGTLPGEISSDGFASFDELAFWANSHEWTGGHAGKVNLDGIEIYLSSRSFTSALATTEIVLYFWDCSSLHIKPFLIIPTQRKNMRVSSIDKVVVIDSYSPSQKEWIESLRVTKDALPLG